MSDRFRIDSHKLIFHPGRVSQWLDSFGDWEKAKSVFPIYVEVSPFGACNHRCVFCAVDYIGYQNVSLEKEMLKERLSEMAGLGIRSVMFAGEGEPALYKPLPEVLDHCSAVGIDTSLTTNMVPFTEKNVDSFLRNCSWIKTSINAGTASGYAKIHQTREEDFTRVMNNFRMCLEHREREGYECTIGAQMILLPENAREAVPLGEQLRDIGVDYLVIKPYSQHSYSITSKYAGLDYRQYDSLDEELQGLNTDHFSVVFRRRTIEKLLDTDHGYERCYSTPFFWSYIMSDGSVYGCSAYLNQPSFCYGNINESSFRDIWESDRRRASYEEISSILDVRQCRQNCRMDEINRYLWELRHPDSHVNFI